MPFILTNFYPPFQAILGEMKILKIPCFLCQFGPMSFKMPFGLLLLLILAIWVPSPSTAIQCYSGNQFSIIECPSLYCIKQTLGLDTVRYCDGTGVSSICSTYRILDTCQNVPNLGYICCCSDQLCNSSPHSTSPLLGKLLMTLASLLAILAFGTVRNKILL